MTIDSGPESAEAPHVEPAPLDGEAVARLIARARVGARRGIVVWTWNLIAILSAFATVWLFLAGYATWPASSSGGDGPLLVLWTTFAWLTAHTMNRQARDLSHAAWALAARDLDRRIVGGLTEALEWPNRNVQTVARIWLTELLPTLTEGDCEILTLEQRTCLYDQLNPRSSLANPDFVVAALKGVCVFGDESVLPNMARLATMRALTKGLRAVRDAARACLPRLEKRLVEARALTPHEPGPLSQECAATDPPRSPTLVPAHVDEALKRIEAELGRPPQMRLSFLLATWAIIVPFCLFAAVCLARSGRLPYGIPLAVLGLAATQLHRLTLTARHRRIARELSELDDVNAVGRLADAVLWPEPAVRAGALSALTRLLPRLRATDSGLLSASQRACLYGTMTREMARSHPEYVVALLKALEQVGDPAAIAPVRQLANGAYRSARQNRVKAAANECLPFLEINARRNQDSAVLLRPASSPAPDPELLLRPAAGTAPVSVETLLRPSLPEEAHSAARGRAT